MRLLALLFFTFYLHITFSQEVKKDTTTFISTTNQLKSNYIPDSIFQMTYLKHLTITGMDCDLFILDDHGKNKTNCFMIREIPIQINQLIFLESLQLNVNSISILPKEISGLKNLKVLDLTDNSNLTDIESIVRLENLEILSLNGCNLSKLPSEIIRLSKLKSLGLTGNPLNEVEKERIKNSLPNCIINF